MKFSLAFALTLFLVLGWNSPAEALKISPFKTTIVPAPGNATQVFRIENNSAEPAAIQISALTWEIRPDGTEVNQDAEDDFAIFPAQVILEPHESKAVRVQWLGEGMPAAEKSYRILAEQVPIALKDTPPAGSALRFLLRFKAGLYVAPEEIKSAVSVEKIEPRPDILRLTLINKGTGHTLLRNPVLELTLNSGKTLTLDKTKLEKLAGENMHAGATRFFDILLPGSVAASVLSAKLDFESGF